MELTVCLISLCLHTHLLYVKNIFPSDMVKNPRNIFLYPNLSPQHTPPQQKTVYLSGSISSSTNLPLIHTFPILHHF